MTEQNSNKKNILYFEASTMYQLFEKLKKWQDDNEKRFLSTSIEKDEGKFCCIAFSNPTEVTLVDSLGQEVSINKDGSMDVYIMGGKLTF